jgi:uncharacterized protein (TIGR01777 family)
MSKKIIITGATGLIGRKMISRLIEIGDEVTVFTRSIDKAQKVIPGTVHFINWDFKSDVWKQHLKGKDAVINLAGENLMHKRWNEEHKKNIRASRILSTRALVNAIEELSDKPKVFITASAVGFYGNSEVEVDETSPAGKGFLAEVVRDWEKESEPLEEIGVRRAVIRIGIVLDKNEGALAKMVLPFKLFLGGPLGSGTQWMPWIHIDDLVNLFLFVIYNENVEGVINGVSPKPVRMREFAKAIGLVLKRPAIFSVPSVILNLILGEASNTVLEGARVMPVRILNYGYKFQFDEIYLALRNLLK